MGETLTNKKNLQKELEKMLPDIRGGILLHCCCAACSTSCLEYLHGKTDDVSLYYFNPNIDTKEEYELRANELARYNGEAGYDYALYIEKYEPQKFYEAVKGLENTGEGGKRCEKCFALRLNAAVNKAAELGKKYVMTTLSVSPHKDAALLYEIGKEAAVGADVTFLPSDFKKGGGFARGGELCRQFGIYRQNYCGCAFSKRERGI
ncbi:MAG: epoxyqueuosine reductase QueH [Clostridia bacterium]|nr:epoxyqueuosine reductase QueH [Clostridia bacterium]